MRSHVVESMPALHVFTSIVVVGYVWRRKSEHAVTGAGCVVFDEYQLIYKVCQYIMRMLVSRDACPDIVILSEHKCSSV